jgi:hypothetical protein
VDGFIAGPGGATDWAFGHVVADEASTDVMAATDAILAWRNPTRQADARPAPKRANPTAVAGLARNSC